MLSTKMILNDLNKIFSHTNSVLIDQNKNAINCHFNRHTKIIFEDGTTITQITALCLADEVKDLRVKHIISIDSISYQITKIERKNQYTKRLYLKQIS
ncbi:hypothetical protein [Campylobacter majalis]|uniref:hypothetical protein n=1 Tax=Campylobacter majalis TaxID=2790656 RepID=UPI003D6872DE